MAGALRDRGGLQPRGHRDGFRAAGHETPRDRAVFKVTADRSRARGLSPKQYHLQLRIRKAQALLTNTSMSFQEVADALGFDSPFHLSADFKMRLGSSPTQWRAQVARRGRR